MREAADVRSLDALREARFALGEYRDVVRTALSEALADAQRTQFWIESDRKFHWRMQLKKRQEKLQQEKSELARAQLAAQGSMVSTREERKRVERAQHAVDDAEQHLRAIARWSTILEREVTIFRGQLQQLGRSIDGDLPKADAKMVNMIEHLEAYIRLPSKGTKSRAAAKKDEAKAETEEKA